MVLRALVTSVRLDRIVGLPMRRTETLTRLVHAFAHERRAAGATVPSEIATWFSVEQHIA
jgi:hypothetical protein